MHGKVNRKERIWRGQSKRSEDPDFTGSRTRSGRPSRADQARDVLTSCSMEERLFFDLICRSLVTACALVGKYPTCTNS